jgi:L-serine/L-threonine ammonia-lyase
MAPTPLPSSSSFDADINCPAHEARSQNLFSQTPLIHSIPLSQLTGHEIFLKLDCLQPSGSFKDRGMAHLCTTVKKVYSANRQHGGAQGDFKMKVISSSGGNAGLAVTTVARNIPEMDVSVVVPETTKPLVIAKLKALGAHVTIHGKVWNEADALARQMVKEAEENGEGSVYVSPYDNPLLWTGHSTVVDEIVTQLMDTHDQPEIGAILASVGGGGLLSGILEGIERNYFGNTKRSNVVKGTKVVACETYGAASFAASFNASGKEINMVRLDGITSVATSLGALEVTPAVIQRSQRHQERGKDSGNGDDVLSLVCTDQEAVDACFKFAADHRMLVEPACGASLAPLYSERLRSKLLEGIDGKDKVIVVEVCGGSGVSLGLLEAWKQQFLM